MSSKDWRLLGFCPECGKKAFHAHKSWSCGSVSDTPYARCFLCGADGLCYMTFPDEGSYYDQFCKGAEWDAMIEKFRKGFR